jgi:hypothetical protein
MESVRQWEVEPFYLVGGARGPSFSGNVFRGTPLLRKPVILVPGRVPKSRSVMMRCMCSLNC